MEHSPQPHLWAFLSMWLWDWSLGICPVHICSSCVLLAQEVLVHIELVPSVRLLALCWVWCSRLIPAMRLRGRILSSRLAQALW